MFSAHLSLPLARSFIFCDPRRPPCSSSVISSAVPTVLLILHSPPTPIHPPLPLSDTRHHHGYDIPVRRTPDDITRDEMDISQMPCDARHVREVFFAGFAGPGRVCVVLWDGRVLRRWEEVQRPAEGEGSNVPRSDCEAVRARRGVVVGRGGGLMS